MHVLTRLAGWRIVWLSGWTLLDHYNRFRRSMMVVAVEMVTVVMVINVMVVMVTVSHIMCKISTCSSMLRLMVLLIRLCLANTGKENCSE